MHNKFAAISLIVCLTSGCVTNPKVDDPHYYYSESKPLTNVISRELKRCAIEAYQMVPARTVVQSSPVMSTPTKCTNFGGRTSCTGGDIYGGQISSYDANDPLREEVRLSCLERVDIHRTYRELPNCPKGFNEGGFAGWFDGRLTAAELATLRISQITDAFANHPSRFSGFHQTCLVQSSLEPTHAGNAGSFDSYPEEFASLTAHHRSNLVDIMKKTYPNISSTGQFLIGFGSYNDLVAAMQLTIDYCRSELDADTFWMEAERLYDADLEKLSKTQICKQGKLAF